MTHYSQIPEKPLIASVSDKVEPATKVFFFERSDGKILAVQEQEAWTLYTRRPQVLGAGKRIDFKLIGTGDGIIFQQAVAKAIQAGQNDVEEAKKIIREGQQAELEACRGRIIPPKNMDELR